MSFVCNAVEFGSELIVMPFTSPVDKTTCLATERVFLPEGRWTDIYNGRIYEGGRFHYVSRPVEHPAVFAKSGALIPLSSDPFSFEAKNPESLTIRVFRGNGEFDLYEDDGETSAFLDGDYVITKMRVTERGSTVRFVLYEPEGDLTQIPANRSYILHFEDVASFTDCKVFVDGKPTLVSIEKQGRSTAIKLPYAGAKQIEVIFDRVRPVSCRDKKSELVDLISSYNMSNIEKRVLFGAFIKDIHSPLPKVRKELLFPIEEILYCDRKDDQ